MTAPDKSRNVHGNIPLWNRLSYPARRKIRKTGFYTLLAVFLAIIVFPLFWMFSSALRQNVFERPVTLLPQNFSLVQFQEILWNSNFLQFYFNSIIISLGVVLLTTVTATLGGYGLARLNISHKKTFARTVIFGYMFPSILLAIPMYIFWRRLNILNTYTGLILAETALALPFSLWLMWKFFQTVPESLEESARMNGATRFGAFFDIALPMAKPGIIAVAVFTYALSWDQYTMPKVLITDLSKWPLTIGIEAFTLQNQVMWGQVMAAVSLAVIPAFLFVYFLQKYLLQGFRVGGIG